MRQRLFGALGSLGLVGLGAGAFEGLEAARAAPDGRAAVAQFCLSVGVWSVAALVGGLPWLATRVVGWQMPRAPSPLSFAVALGACAYGVLWGTITALQAAT
ncbi:MAG: hypothetical protein KC620_19760, partial [Myxococcales bacterium]|nr:hypothetical protein [Myxococcales bacterium]